MCASRQVRCNGRNWRPRHDRLQQARSICHWNGWRIDKRVTAVEERCNRRVGTGKFADQTQRELSDVVRRGIGSVGLGSRQLGVVVVKLPVAAENSQQSGDRLGVEGGADERCGAVFTVEVFGYSAVFVTAAADGAFLTDGLKMGRDCRISAAGEHRFLNAGPVPALQQLDERARSGRSCSISGWPGHQTSDFSWENMRVFSVLEYLDRLSLTRSFKLQ